MESNSAMSFLERCICFGVGAFQVAMIYLYNCILSLIYSSTYNTQIQKKAPESFQRGKHVLVSSRRP